jgi:hypothetical protein
MRRVRGLKRGRFLSLLVAGFLGYLLGVWHGGAVRPSDLSASQSVALRFPETNANAAVVETAADMPTGTASTAELKQARLVLLSPQPMAPVVAAPTVRPPETAASLPTASAPLSLPPPAAPPLPRPEAKSAALTPHAEPKAPAAAAATPHHAARPGFLLNDAQIASIKERLHLTADQVRMWPAVEAALRNIAYAKERYARRHGAPAAGSEVASIDPNASEVQDLKSAAIPLIMSFSDEQKNEVRSLAHVMGLDKLASEF